MGVELGVGSDTKTLRGKRGRHRCAPHPILRASAAGALFVLGCGQAPAPAADAGPGADSVAQAEALVAGAPLPPRLETVALADAVALASVRERLAPGAPGAPGRGAALARLAADLRARLWRLDQAAADAREAIELYG